MRNYLIDSELPGSGSRPPELGEPEPPAPSSPPDMPEDVSIPDAAKPLLERALAKIRTASESRYCVGFLADCYRFRNADIAEAVQVSRPRVKQQRQAVAT